MCVVHVTCVACHSTEEPKQLVLLDEATMDLDLLARRAVLDFLARDDVAVVNVTHVFDGLEGWVTHFVHLHNGEVVKCEAVPAEGPRLCCDGRC